MYLPNLSSKKDMIKTKELLSSRRLVLNALGTKFEIRQKTLEAFPPDSRLGKLKDFRYMSESELGQICDEYDLENMEFYFERDPDILRMILNFYITGQFHLVSNLCEIFVENEFNYWQVQWKDMRVCCRSYQQIGYEAKLREIASEQFILKVAREQTKSDQGYNQKLWTLVSNPNSSKAAMGYFILSNVILMIWLVISVVTTLPELTTTIVNVSNSSNASTPTISQAVDVDYPPLSFYSDLVTYSFFLADILVRFYLCPQKLHFLTSLLNLIDIFSIIAFFVEFILYFAFKVQHLKSVRNIIGSTRVFLFMRLKSYSWRFKTIENTIYKSYAELLVAGLFLALNMVTISMIMFYLEREENPAFKSVPAAFWWTIVSMTTVGYGDIPVKTTLGKMFGGLTLLEGIILLALPVAVFGSNFNKIYSEEERKNRMLEQTKRDRQKLKRAIKPADK